MKLLLVAFAAAALLSAADQKLGSPLTLKEPVAVADIYAHPENYTGKTVQVKGKVTEVCQEMGCWMNLANDAGQTIRIKVEDGVIVFPKDSAGKMAVAEGKLAKTEKAPYQIDGTGAVILDK